MSISDILIHINETLTQQQRGALEETVRQVDGVIAPRFNPGREHLLLVAFDPEATTMDKLLDVVRGKGYSARLIGA